MIELSALAEETIAHSHTVVSYGTVNSPWGYYDRLRITGGSVTLDASSQVRGTAEITIADPELWPASPASLLSPFGAEITLYRGVRAPGQDDAEWVQLGVFGLSKAARELPISSSGAATLSLEDRSARVAESRFLNPTQTRAGFSAVAEITRFVQAVFPGVEVLDSTGVTAAAAKIEIDKERWETIEKLADSIAAEVYFDRFGRLVIRPQPTTADQVRWRITSGPGGVLVSRKDEVDRARMFNAVKVEAQRSDGSPGVSAVVYDDDPRSPTRWGPGMQKPRFYATPLVTTQAQATQVGRALLERVKGAAYTVAFTTLVHPGLDPCDVVQLDHQGKTTTHILDSVTIPLGPGDAQDTATRSVELPEES